MLAVLLAAALAATPAPTAPAAGTARVLLETGAGPILVEVDLARAPITARNFLRYVEAGRYAEGRFHRTVTPGHQNGNPVEIAVVQAGVAPWKEAADFAPIRLERTSLTGLRHLDGTLSMARDGADSATSEFFICVGDQPALDFGGGRNPDGQGFAAFGRVVRGLDVVRRIWRAPADDQTLTPPISISRAQVVPASPPPRH